MRCKIAERELPAYVGDNQAMRPLLQSLWDLEDKQSQWTVDEVEAHDHGKARLTRFLEEILGIFRQHLNNVDQALIQLTGFQPGYFSPVVSYNFADADLQPTPTDFQQGRLVHLINSDSSIALVDNPTSEPAYRGAPDIRSRCILKLVAAKDCFGFIILDSKTAGAFGAHEQTLTKACKALSRIVAEAVLAMRMRLIGAPVRVTETPISKDGLQAICRELVRRTVFGFGADGAVLRLYNRRTDLLECVASEGDISKILTEARSNDAGLAGQVFSADGNAWALQDADAVTADSSRGITVLQSVVAPLKAQGIHAFIIAKLVSYSSLGSTTNLGTLSFFHRRPYHFSWQEISLFQMHCQNVADTISLHETTIALDEAAENLRGQNQMLTRVEVMALLAHDFGHKALEATILVSNYIDACKKTLNNPQERRTHSHLDERAAAALAGTSQLGTSVNQFRQLYQGDAQSISERSTFDLRSVFESIEKTLAGALNRTKVTLKCQFQGNTSFYGAKEVLLQVFYNLFINSLDAMRGKSKPGSIYVHAHEETAGTRRIIIQFWDEGPGINRQAFPDPRDIFLIGRTSKRGGTGTGLPVARSLLSQYFKGDISLDRADQARFKIVLPERKED